jgi:hypothetical protein
MTDEKGFGLLNRRYHQHESTAEWSWNELANALADAQRQYDALAKQNEELSSLVAMLSETLSRGGFS